MIDATEIDAAITTKITEAVAEQVENLFKNDDALLANLRSQAASLVVRNFNTDELATPNLSNEVAMQIATLLVKQAPDQTLLDVDLINKAVADNIVDATASHVASVIDTDPTIIDAAISTKLSEAVTEQVENLFNNNEALITNLRSQAASLVVRNFNNDKLATDNLANNVAAQIAEMLAEQDNSLLDVGVITKAVADNMVNATASHVASVIDTDPTIMLQLKNHAVTALVRNVTMDKNIEEIIASKIAAQFAEQFDGTGIHSDATTRELTIMDEAVVVENSLAATNVSVVNQFVTKDAIVNGDLVVHGNVTVDTGAWDNLKSAVKLDVIDVLETDVKEKIVDDVISKADLLNFKGLRLNGITVLAGNTLGGQITKSSLTSVGKLANLDVRGNSTLGGGTLHVEGKRVGINTRTPNAGLDIWDDEVEVIVGKRKFNTAYIGTTRKQSLEIGVDHKADISIDADGVVSIRKLKIGSRSILHGNKTPSWSGNPGDLVLNTGLTVVDPIFAWYCVEDFRWIPLRAVV